MFEWNRIKIVRTKTQSDPQIVHETGQHTVCVCVCVCHPTAIIFLPSHWWSHLRHLLVGYSHHSNRLPFETDWDRLWINVYLRFYHHYNCYYYYYYHHYFVLLVFIAIVIIIIWSQENTCCSAPTHLSIHSFSLLVFQVCFWTLFVVADETIKLPSDHFNVSRLKFWWSSRRSLRLFYQTSCRCAHTFICTWTWSCASVTFSFTQFTGESLVLWRLIFFLRTCRVMVRYNHLFMSTGVI